MTQENEKLFQQIQKIARVILNEMNRDEQGRSIYQRDLCVYDGRKAYGINPYYGQSESGLFLNYYYGVPNEIWTPWGKFHFAGCTSYRSGTPEKILAPILEMFGSKLHEPVVRTHMGEYGPVYGLYRVDGEDLPEPVLRNGTYLPYQESLDQWNELLAKYPLEPCEVHVPK